MNESINSAERAFEPDDTDRSMVWLWSLAATIIVLTAVTPYAFWAWGYNGYLALAFVTGLVALATTSVVEHIPVGRALWLIIAVAVLLRGALLFTEPLLSSDIYRYVWDGRTQAAGVNPYRYFPADEALKTLRDAAIFPHINRADYAVTIYPPVAEMFFLAVTRISESVTMMKLGLLACEGVTVTFLFVLLRRIGRPATRLVAYLWHPLPLWEISNSGHVDALMTALMMMGLWLGLTGRPLRGASSIAVGALAKPIAVFALPVIWRPWDWKLPLIVLTTFVLCYIPYLSVGWGVFGFLTQGYLYEQGFNSGDRIWPLAAWRWIFGTLQGDLLIYFAIAILLIAGLAFHAAFRSQRLTAIQLASINNLLLACLFVVSPNYPWYYLVATPFVALVGGAPVWAMTLGAVFLREEDEFIPELLRKSFLYGAFIAACIYWFWRSRLNGLHSGHSRNSKLDAH
jgi:alpha-1,6-mannosyltransferase